MKRAQKYSIIFLMWLLILPIINFAYAAEKPDYVGINENDTIIWRTTFDEGAYEDYLEDRGYSDAAIEIIMDDNPLFDDLFDEDVEAWKVVIVEIKEEKEYDLDDDYPTLDDDDYKGVPYLYNIYISENYEDDVWDEEDTNERDEIYKYDKELYATFVLYNEMWLQGSGIGPMLFVAKGVNWDRVVSEVDDELDDNYEDAGASVPTDSTYLIERDVDGIRTYRDYGEDIGNDDVGEFTSEAQFTNDGILKYYEWNYDGDPIYLIELEQSWFIANWWVIAIIAVVAIIIIIVIAKKR